ncbi:MAG: methionyl-tRNA formyltransferase [Pseudohongiellaceae bacterium]|jgi:methionyl-tRNA formyltransferase
MVNPQDESWGRHLSWSGGSDAVGSCGVSHGGPYAGWKPLSFLIAASLGLPMTAPVFAFLLLREHPYGREMLQQLLKAGHRPALIIEEDSPVAAVEGQKFLARTAGHAVAPTIAEQAGLHGLSVRAMPKLKSRALLDCFDSLTLDLIVLGGTGILRGDVLSYPQHGVINSHPGLLPECRGSASPAWSVFHDLPVGATTHFCDAGIDTGDLLLRREFAVRRGMTYEDLCHGTQVLAGTLMVEALNAYCAGGWGDLRHSQGESPWPTFKNAPDDVLAVVRRKLADEAYEHFVA